MAFDQNVQAHLLWDFIEKIRILFLSHNFGTWNARKPNKALKTRNIVKFPKKF